MKQSIDNGGDVSQRRTWDDIVIHLGEFGRYQKRIYVILCIPVILIASTPFYPVFILGEQRHRCAIPEMVNDTYSVQSSDHERYINFTIPISAETGLYSECTRYSFPNTSDKSLALLNIQNESFEITCDSWVYDMETFETTLNSEMNLVCEDTDVQSHVGMLYYGGAMMGALITGILSDIFGRKPTTYFSIVLGFCANLAGAFSPSAWVYGALRFLAGAALSGYWNGAFVIVLEYVGPSKRVWAGMIIEFFWVAAELLFCALGYGIRSWRYLQIATAAPMGLFVFYWFFIPESPRWLLSKGRHKEVQTIIQKMAKVNGVDIPDITTTMAYEENEKSSVNMKQILQHPKLLLRLIICIFNWAVLTIAYVGLTLNAGHIGGNVYVNFLASSMMEFVSYSFILLVMNRLGRKPIYCWSMLIGGVACLATIFSTIFASTSLNWITITLSMIGKLGVSTGFAIMFIYTPEMFPTAIRGFILGLCSFAGTGGSAASPYIANLGVVVKTSIGKALPLIIIGSMSVASALLTLSFPETRNYILPETVEDAADFSRLQRKDVNKMHLLHTTTQQTGALEHNEDAECTKMI